MMSKDPRITSNSDGHFEPAVERHPEHKGNEPDFAGEWSKGDGMRHLGFIEAITSYGQRMYELGKAARPQDAPDVAAIRERCEKATKGPLTIGPDPEEPVMDEDDLNFFAHARTDIPLLLDALAAARAEKAAAYRAGLEAAANYVKTHTSARECPPQLLWFSESILALPIPEKWGGVK